MYFKFIGIEQGTERRNSTSIVFKILLLQIILIATDCTEFYSCSDTSTGTGMKMYIRDLTQCGSDLALEHNTNLWYTRANKPMIK